MARILLVPGFWLGAWAWDEVADDLRRHGDEVLALTLPGLDPHDADRLDATLERQAEAIVEATDGRPAVLVAHSGGGAAAYLACDLAPERFSRAIYVDSAPLPNGFVLNSELDLAAREYPLPHWDELTADGDNLAGLDEEALATFRARAVSEPIAVATAPLRLSEQPAGRWIPTTVICNTFTAEVVGKLRDEGEMPMFAELARMDAEYVDLPTGHWPMWSKPHELAELIHTVAQR
ncbi:alpha/beta fold hydrolase [Nocardia cyriacigeorgica]|uniref:alpha/beta fold hydrolase n=1 Tax=Nocardia cyriacigeorgica TaxID=135487 RepID=UPI0018936DE4|nr:alpha/beta fold hydrolase [Nocardia cyriacigeorgica]MBF6438982.1 alpha/beta hydrolase [Nocardia cyriacigeorgica]